MSNIVTAKVSIKGTRPLLWHRFGPESIPLEKKERTGVAGNDPQEWQRTVLHTKEGQLYLEPSYVFGTMRDAAKYTKSGRYLIQKYLVATLQVEDDRVLVDRWIPNFNDGAPTELTQDPDEPVYLDVRGVRNPTNRARNVRYRVATSTGWQTTFTLLWDCTIVSREQMEAVAIDAGRLVGLGDGRSIGFGRFELVEFVMGE